MTQTATMRQTSNPGGITKGQRFLHSRVLDSMYEISRQRVPQLYEITKVAGGLVYYRALNHFGKGSAEYTPVEKFPHVVKEYVGHDYKPPEAHYTDFSSKQNPAHSPEQYRLAQAVLSGTARDAHMPKSVAREIVDRTPAKLRREWGKKRNPEAASESMYSSFHGVPSTETLEYSQDLHYHGNLAALGELVELKINLLSGDKAVLTFDTSDEQKENPYSESEGLDRMSDKALLQEYKDMRRASFGIHGGNAKRRGNAVVDELLKRGIKMEPNIFGDMPIRKFNPKDKANPIWPFSSHSRTVIYHLGSGDEYKLTGTHKGYKIYKEPTGGFAVPKLDADSRFDTKKDAERFIDSWKKARPNPKHKHGPFHEAGKLLSHGTKLAHKPFEQFGDVVGQVGGYLDDTIGKAVNPMKPYPEAYQVGLHARGHQGIHSKKAALKEFEAWYDYRSNHIDPAYSKEDFKRQFLIGWGARKLNPQVPSANSVMLCSSEDGRSIFVVGGDQSVNLSDLKIKGPAAEKDFVVIGDITHVVYRTRKDFDKMTETDYVHEFSEDSGGPLPELVYDRRNEKLNIVGGVYFIKQPLLQTSPGLED